VAGSGSESCEGLGLQHYFAPVHRKPDEPRGCGGDGWGLEHLAGLNDHVRLDLGGTRVTGAGPTALAGLHSLDRLALTGTPVTDAGVQALRKALPGSAILG
jgi:hypothetical protein